jgi:tetratricopeptide (TPR) repeat protein
MSVDAAAPTDAQPAAQPAAQPLPVSAALTLDDWARAMECALARGDHADMARMAQIVLTRLPRHVATYQRLLRLTWAIKHWEEGEDWARRLLQADPGNPWAWQTLAGAAEQRQQRAQAHALWQRAFTLSPYAPEIRAGLARTSLDAAQALALDLACLAAIYLRGLRWEPAARAYRQLVKADPRRIDFQVGLMVALWQSRARDEAYVLARHLVQSQPHLLLAWVVLDALGDENDQALARHPIRSMDPTGEYVATWLGPLPNGPVQTSAQHEPPLAVGAEEREWVAAYLAAA